MYSRHEAFDVANSGEAFDIVHGSTLRNFPDLVADLGGDASQLLHHVGINAVDLGQGGSGISYRGMIQLIEHAAAVLQCPDFGMRLATRQGGALLLGPLGSVMRHSRTFGEALDYVRTHSYAHSLAVNFRIDREPDAAAIFVAHDILLDGSPVKTQTIEKLLLDGAFTVRTITDGKVRPRRVHFRHRPHSPLNLYRRHFGCEVRFGQEDDGMFYFDRDLACPIVNPDAGAYQQATSFIERRFTRRRPPVKVQARGLILRLMTGGDCSNERVAAELNLHPRTLHRRLAMEGTSFRQVLDEVRRDRLVYYAQQTDLCFASISERLGFTEQAVMTKSCNRWFAMSPSRLRAEARRDTVKDMNALV